MYKIKFSIGTENIFFDREVFVEIEMPYVPRKGDVFYLTDEQEKELERQILAKEKSWDYMDCYYGKSANVEKPEDLRAEDLSVEDWIYVDGVAYDVKDNQIWISLSNGVSK